MGQILLVLHTRQTGPRQLPKAAAAAAGKGRQRTAGTNGITSQHGGEEGAWGTCNHNQADP